MRIHLSLDVSTYIYVYSYFLIYPKTIKIFVLFLGFFLRAFRLSYNNKHTDVCLGKQTNTKIIKTLLVDGLHLHIFEISNRKWKTLFCCYLL